MSSRSLPPLNALRTFEAAARHLNFTRAAEELCVTQAAVSHQIKVLEDWLGFTLFSRRHNTLALTEKGSHYMLALNDVFQSIADSTAQVVDSEANKILSIHVRPHFASRWLVPRLRDFCRQNPDIQLRIITSYQPIDSLFEDIDVAIRTEEDVPDLRYDFLFSGDVFPVCSPRLLDETPIRTAADLARCTRLHVLSAADEWRALLECGGVKETGIDNGPRFETNELALDAAASGWGVALGRWPFVERAIREGSLVVPLDLRLHSRKTWHLVCARSARRRKIDVFRVWLLAQAAQTRTAMDQHFRATADRRSLPGTGNIHPLHRLPTAKL